MSETIPVVMYVHGFRSGANGSKRVELQKHFGDRCRVVAPELDADPESSLAALNEMIARERPDMIVGTSLGGWMTLMCESGDARLVVVNPCVDAKQTLSQWEGEELPYFCRRLDGVQTYTVTKEVLDKYDRYDLGAAIAEKADRIYALCSRNDELLGESHIRYLSPMLAEEHLVVTDDFGHRCSGAGMTHLYNIMESLGVV